MQPCTSHLRRCFTQVMLQEASNRQRSWPVCDLELLDRAAARVVADTRRRVKQVQHCMPPPCWLQMCSSFTQELGILQDASPSEDTSQASVASWTMQVVLVFVGMMIIKLHPGECGSPAMGCGTLALPMHTPGSRAADWLRCCRPLAGRLLRSLARTQVAGARPADRPPRTYAAVHGGLS